MSNIVHVKMSMPIGADGFIHLRDNDVIRPEVFAEALAKNKLVEQGSIVHGHDDVQWVQHMTKGLADEIARAQAEAGTPSIGVSVGALEVFPNF